MGTQNNKTVGVSRDNTSIAVSSATGSGVTTSGSADPVETPDLALLAFMAALGPLVTTLQPSIERPLPGHKVTSTRGDYETVAPMVSALAKRYPELEAVGDPTVIDQGIATLAAARSVSQQLTVLQGQIDDTGRMGFDAGWDVVGLILHRADQLAKGDKTLAGELATIRSNLTTGSRTAAAARNATKAEEEATTASARSTKAQGKATQAREVATATANLDALRHGTGDAVVTQPAPSAPVTSALADAPAPTGTGTIR